MTRKSCHSCEHCSEGLSSASCQGCTSEAGLPGWEPKKESTTDCLIAVVPRPTPKTEPKQHLGMDNAKFTGLVNELRERSFDTLLKKNANYANEDRLHNFRVGAALIGGTPAQAALGYMAKHIASLIDKVKKDDFSDREDLLEKCQDIINYICFIWCCGNEGRDAGE